MSLRIPPNLNAVEGSKFLHKLLTDNPPFGAHVSFENVSEGSGFNAPVLEKWLS